MSRGWNYVPGDWLSICDSCGRKFKASQLRKRWDGFMVCSEDWEARHPQDFLKSKPDNQTVPWTRPQSGLVFISANGGPLTINGSAINATRIG